MDQVRVSRELAHSILEEAIIADLQLGGSAEAEALERVDLLSIEQLADTARQVGVSEAAFTTVLARRHTEIHGNQQVVSPYRRLQGTIAEKAAQFEQNLVGLYGLIDADYTCSQSVDIGSGDWKLDVRRQCSEPSSLKITVRQAYSWSKDFHEIMNAEVLLAHKLVSKKDFLPFLSKLVQEPTLRVIVRRLGQCESSAEQFFSSLAENPASLDSQSKSRLAYCSSRWSPGSPVLRSSWS